MDLDRGLLTIRGGKGDRDRVTMIPNSLQPHLKKQMTRVRKQWEEDRENNVPGVALPGALSRKFPKAGVELAWQWFFPAIDLSGWESVVEQTQPDVQCTITVNATITIVVEPSSR